MTALSDVTFRLPLSEPFIPISQIEGMEERTEKENWKQLPRRR